jgi:hypothetical protein
MYFCPLLDCKSHELQSYTRLVKNYKHRNPHCMVYDPSETQECLFINLQIITSTVHKF